MQCALPSLQPLLFSFLHDSQFLASHVAEFWAVRMCTTLIASFHLLITAEMVAGMDACYGSFGCKAGLKVIHGTAVLLIDTPSRHAL
jgi:hypothetical protein